MTVREEVPVVVAEVPQPNACRERLLAHPDAGGSEHTEVHTDQRLLQGGHARRLLEEVHQPCASRAGRSQHPHQLALQRSTTEGLGTS